MQGSPSRRYLGTDLRFPIAQYIPCFLEVQGAVLTQKKLTVSRAATTCGILAFDNDCGLRTSHTTGDFGVGEWVAG
jgi:hypothetical protein